MPRTPYQNLPSVDLGTDLHLKILGKRDREKLDLLRDALEGAILNKKTGINYAGNGRCLTLQLRRVQHKRKRFLWFLYTTCSHIYSKPCILTIREILACDIYEDPRAAAKEEIEIAIGFSKDQLYIGSGIGHDADNFCISLKINEIDIALNDLTPVENK